MSEQPGSRRRRGLVPWITGLALAGANLWTTAWTLAQEEGGPRRLDPAKPTTEWVIGSIFIIGVLVVAFKNSKRSHVQ